MMHSNKQTFVSGLISNITQVRFSVQNWIRREIVDDDPYDVESLFDSELPNRSPSTTDRAITDRKPPSRQV
ncbi:hypothetical protein [Thermocoleostomius sinensis]|jgi:hypothetical protein|uniref:Uncharacterized protein n=1 Tax=Thermocoleostomius sinensis A174 TaxID=2016057 RepID=A0A9E8ZCS8_9CYAN|nr:hypothetical protein [Thermocoleostomius sinensis]WAL59472.1 hypothetical protein OXH18_20205 [Thermocoleostomius sinensis A174]